MSHHYPTETLGAFADVNGIRASLLEMEKKLTGVRGEGLGSMCDSVHMYRCWCIVRVEQLGVGDGEGADAGGGGRDSCRKGMCTTVHVYRCC